MTKPKLDFPLDLGTVVGYIATEIDERGPETAPSVDEIVATYRHVHHADLARLRTRFELDSDRAATRKLVELAIERLGDQVETVADGTLHLKRPFDGLRLGRRKVRRYIKEQPAKFPGGDAFDVLSGAFRENTRVELGDLEPLKASMREWGWKPLAPVFVDEDGRLLAGHRRRAAAEELRKEGLTIVEPKPIVIRRRGSFDYDRERLFWSLESNNVRAYTKPEQRRIAQFLYGEEHWSEQRIAEALHVSQPTISRALDSIQMNTEREEEPASKKKHKVTPEDEAEIVWLHAHEWKWKDIAAKLGVSPGSIGRALEADRRRKSAYDALVALELAGAPR